MEAVAGSNGTLSVSSCRFFHAHCSRPLFQDMYMRSNKMKGAKILRCFPHCCPGHLSRCYCGTSLHVEIKYKKRKSTPTKTRQKKPMKGQEGEHSDLVVYARFEPMNGTSMLKMGDTIPHSVLLEDSRTKEEGPEDDPDAAEYEKPWIQTEVDTKQEEEGGREEEGREGDDEMVVFVMNNCRFPKWYYAYESGSTKTQREMKHQIKAYVFEKFNSQGMEMLRVVGMCHSTPFMIISYRRAKNFAGKNQGFSNLSLASGEGDHPHLHQLPHLGNSYSNEHGGAREEGVPIAPSITDQIPSYQKKLQLKWRERELEALKKMQLSQKLQARAQRNREKEYTAATLANGMRGVGGAGGRAPLGGPSHHHHHELPRHPPGWGGPSSLPPHSHGLSAYDLSSLRYSPYAPPHNNTHHPSSLEYSHQHHLHRTTRGYNTPRGHHEYSRYRGKMEEDYPMEREQEMDATRMEVDQEDQAAAAEEERLVAYELQQEQRLKQMRYIGVIGIFISSLSMEDVSFCLTNIEQFVDKWTLDRLSSSGVEKLSSHSATQTWTCVPLEGLVSPHVNSSSTTTCTNATTTERTGEFTASPPSHYKSIVSTCVDVVSCVFFLPSIRGLLQKFLKIQSQRLLFQATNSSTNLQQVFLQLTSLLYRELSSFLAQRRPSMRIEQLVDDIVGLVYQYRPLFGLRTNIRHMLEMQACEPTQNAGFQAFVAQMREISIIYNSKNSTTTSGVPSRPTSHLYGVWNGVWLLDAKSFRPYWPTAPSTTSSPFQLSLLTVLRRMSEFLCIKLIRKNHHVVAFQSESSFLPRREYSCLILDGKRRVCRLFPNGLSTMMLLEATMTTRINGVQEAEGQDETHRLLYGEYEGTISRGGDEAFQVIFYGTTLEFQQVLRTRIKVSLEEETLRVRTITERHPKCATSRSSSHTSRTWEQVLAFEVVYHKLTHLP